MVDGASAGAGVYIYISTCSASRAARVTETKTDYRLGWAPRRAIADTRKWMEWACRDMYCVVPQIDPSVPQPVVQSRRRPLLGPSPG